MRALAALCLQAGALPNSQPPTPDRVAVGGSGYVGITWHVRQPPSP